MVCLVHAAGDDVGLFVAPGSDGSRTGSAESVRESDRDRAARFFRAYADRFHCQT